MESSQLSSRSPSSSSASSEAVTSALDEKSPGNGIHKTEIRPSSVPTAGSVPEKDPSRQAAVKAIPIPTLMDSAAILAIYPVTLALASLSTVLFTPQQNYFSYKRNIFNTVFVKYGWFWTTIVYFYHVSRLRRTPIQQAFTRWGLATLWWYFVTQWCFGPPLMDRAFLITGGTCDIVQDPVKAAASDMSDTRIILTSAACKIAKGTWKGGHDLSGHVFLLVHASLFLWNEIMPVLQVGTARHWRHWATSATCGLLVLWWWMLVMTGVHFHTWREKVRIYSFQILLRDMTNRLSM